MSAGIKSIGRSIARWVNGKGRDIENSPEQVRRRAEEAEKKTHQAADQVTLSAAKAAGDLKALEGDKAELQANFDKWYGRAEKAKAAGDMDLARTAAEKAVKFKTRLDSVTAEYNAAKARVDSFKDKASDFQNKADDASFKADSIVRRSEMAESEKEFHDAVHGADGKGAQDSLDDLDRLVTKQEGFNEARSEMVGDDTEAKFKDLEKDKAVDALLAGLGSGSSEPAPADADVDMKIAK